MSEAVYILCALTSLACALLLLRSWHRTRAPVLFWSSLCFVGLMLNNVLLVLDKIVVPNVDLSLVTKVPAVIGLGVFFFSLVLDRDAS
jgi:hypothetical protein